MKKCKLFLMVFCLFMVGCSHDDDPVVLIPETTTVSLAGEGDSVTVAVTCNGKWTAVPSLDWCKVTVKDAAVVISAEENKTGAELKADVILTCGDTKAVVKVTQGVAVDPINGVFAETAKHWYFDFTGFEGAYKTAYEASVAEFASSGWKPNGQGYALKWMHITQDTITFMIHDEDYKAMGAPEAMYVYKGALLVTIEAVAKTKDQVVFKEVKVDPNADEDDKGDYWYENEQWRSEAFRTFVNVLMAQKYTIVADDVSNPQRLTFTGVTDTGSVFKLKLQE